MKITNLIFFFSISFLYQFRLCHINKSYFNRLNKLCDISTEFLYGLVFQYYIASFWFAKCWKKNLLARVVRAEKLDLMKRFNIVWRNFFGLFIFFLWSDLEFCVSCCKCFRILYAYKVNYWPQYSLNEHCVCVCFFFLLSFDLPVAIHMRTR